MEPEQHPVPEPKWPSAAASVFVWAKDQLTPAAEAPNFRELRALERELATALAEITSLNELLEDIPEIFERKFEQRLQPVLERQERLLDDNAALRQQIEAARVAFLPAEVLVINPALRR